MFEFGLGPDLVDALLKVSQNVPACTLPIQDRLLASVSAILDTSKAIPSTGSKEQLHKLSEAGVQFLLLLVSFFYLSFLIGEVKTDPRTTLTLLALRTLASFSFEQHNLL